MLKTIILNTASHRKTAFFKEDGSHHDRNLTLGGSEVGMCIRRSWFAKHGEPTDPDYIEGWGFFARGHLVEDWVVNIITEGMPSGAEYLYTGGRQTTLIDGQVSATPDGLYVTEDGEEVVVEIKSLDPRSNMDKPKEQHIFQAQLQIELFNKLTNHSPNRAVLIYVNASDFSQILQHEVERDEETLLQAHRRAKQVFTSNDPSLLHAEGAWGDECRYCGYTEGCGNAVINSYPSDKTPTLPLELEEELEEMVMERNNTDLEIKELTVEKKQIEEEIKTFLREHNTKGAKNDLWSVSYSLVNGRKSLDTKAVEDAGINLEPFYKSGRQGERLTIRVKGSE